MFRGRFFLRVRVSCWGDPAIAAVPLLSPALASTRMQYPAVPCYPCFAIPSAALYFHALLPLECSAIVSAAVHSATLHCGAANHLRCIPIQSDALHDHAMLPLECPRFPSCPLACVRLLPLISPALRCRQLHWSALLCFAAVALLCHAVHSADPPYIALLPFHCSPMLRRHLHWTALLCCRSFPLHRDTDRLSTVGPHRRGYLPLSGTKRNVPRGPPRPVFDCGRQSPRPIENPARSMNAASCCAETRVSSN